MRLGSRTRASVLVSLGFAWVFVTGGKVTTTQTSTVSADGKTRTVRTTGVNASGQKANNVAVYERH